MYIKKTKVAINGFGRIGRITFRLLTEKKNIEVVAINDIADTHTLAHLCKYDSIQNRFHGDVSNDAEHIIVNGNKIPCFNQKDPRLLPWENLGVDVVLESTGKFTSRLNAGAHLYAGAKRVIISAPADKDVPTIVYGVNDHILTGKEDILSNASCTTNCLVPMLKVLDDLLGIEHGFMTTIHAYTSDQRLHDAPHKDLRRARAAALSMVPTSTGAAKAVSLVLPHLKGKIFGKAIRVPVPDGSLTDVVCKTNKSANRDEINNAFKIAAENQYSKIIEYTTDPIVSVDVIGTKYSVIFDSLLTEVYGDEVNIVGWYDNEGGYSYRVVDLIEKVASFLSN